MKRMILGTMMTVLLTVAVSAQENDSIVKQEFNRGQRPPMEMREHRPMPHRMDSGMRHENFERRDFRGEGRANRMERPEGRPEMRPDGRPHERFEDQKKLERPELSPEQMAEMKAAFLKERLTLTEKQGKKLEKVFLQEAKDLKEVKEKEGDPAEVKEKTDKKVKKILTEEQFAKYQELGKKNTCKFGNKPGCHPGCKPGCRQGFDQEFKPQGFHKPHILPRNHRNHPYNRDTARCDVKR